MSPGADGPPLSMEALLRAAQAVSEWLDDPRNVPASFGGPRSAANHARRVLKVCEESGEVWKAWSRATGENPRLGTSPDGWHAVGQELADVAMAALAGLFHLTGRQDDVSEYLRQAALKSASRAARWHLENDDGIEFPDAAAVTAKLSAMVAAIDGAQPLPHRVPGAALEEEPLPRNGTLERSSPPGTPWEGEGSAPAAN